MRRTVAAVVGLALMCGAAWADTFYYPDQKNPQFEITFPASWTAKVNSDGVLHAFPGNWEVYWIMTVVKGDEKDNAKAEEAMTKRIEQWIKDYTYDEKETTFKVNDIEFWKWAGKGVDNYKESKTFGKPVVVDYVEFVPEEGVVGHIISFEDPSVQAKYAAELKGILESIKKAKK